MTGIAHTLFGGAGLYAPFNLAPRVEYSLPRMMKENGYRVVVIYPTTGSFINARNAYAFYGADRQIDNSENHLGWESPDTDVFNVFDAAWKEEHDAHPGQPMFFLVLTLRQHGPHMQPLNELPPPYDKPLFPGKLDDWLNLNITNYLYRLEQSDKAMAALEERLFASDKPLVLLHFGDHQPSFDGAIRNLEKTIPKDLTDSNKVTYYMLKSNFVPHEKFDYPVLDIIYLGGVLLDVADLRRNDYYEANTLLRERCKGRYFDCAKPKLLDSYHAYVFETLHALKD
jgi:phosphoglycerol transferase MdoB-like AlkP superfamily enzyme